MNDSLNLQLEKLYSVLNENEARLHPPAKVKSQIETLLEGVRPLNLLRPCRIGDGIIRIDESKEKFLLELYDKACSSGRFMKFVPASGAATRMFRKIQVTLNEYSDFDLGALKIIAADDENAKSTLRVITELKRFAFFDDLVNLIGNQSFENLIENSPRKLLEGLLYPSGLNYSNKPKAVLKFHKYLNDNRTAFEEHLIESYHYQKDFQNRIKLHFTISEEHQSYFNSELKLFQNKNPFPDAEFIVEFSFQNKSTESIALTLDDKIFFDDKNRPVFRPAGHGALLENLNNLNADIIFIKNIDNVCVDRLKPITTRYKKLLAGFLILLQKQIFEYLTLLEEEKIPVQKISEIIKFCETFLNIQKPDGFNIWELKKKKNYLRAKLNRPLRVCGVVKNENQPGGAPFWVRNENGENTVQIVEYSQINFEDDQQLRIFNSSTHFNPVDIVCGVRNFKGDKFNLTEYTDPKASIIVKKTVNGTEVKSLELPGLWNGAMANWISVFVEVPTETFNPVKEITDLLNPGHQENI